MKKRILFLSTLLLAVFACSDDDNNGGTTNSVSFSVPSINLTENTTNIVISFSNPTSTAGTITLSLNETSAQYGEDYTTNPESSSNELQITFSAGVTETSFEFNKLIPAFEGEIKNVIFTISEVSNNYQVYGNSSVQLNFNETALTGSSLEPEVGGPNQANQVYIDLSSGAMRTVPRVSWDLGFYAGNDFRVMLNNSVKMSAKSLSSTDMAIIASEDSSMIIAQGAGSVNQIDDPTGIITGTTIAEISANDNDNYVYLINLGSGPSETAPALGSVAADGGPHRGWKKVRILRNGNGYKLQYANIDSTTFNEVYIEKNSAYNFTFFSFTSESTVNVEPEKDKWDINFTTFTNVVNFGTPVPYFYPDFVVNNSRGGTLVYAVSTNDFSYDSFSSSDVDNSKFIDDQRGIGSSWRATSTGNPPVSQFVLKTDIFYILKDPAGNLYKIKMTGGALESQERGHPTFIYELL